MPLSTRKKKASFSIFNINKLKKEHIFEFHSSNYLQSIMCDYLMSCIQAETFHSRKMNFIPVAKRKSVLQMSFTQCFWVFFNPPPLLLSASLLENPLSSKCCMSGVPRGAAVAALSLRNLLCAPTIPSCLGGLLVYEHQMPNAQKYFLRLTSSLWKH